MPKTIRRRPVPDIDGFGQQLPPLLRRIYAARGVCSDAELQYRLQNLAQPASLAGVERAAEILAGAIREDRRILIVGDFDADGATSTALAVLGLRAMGAREPIFRVPSRFADGYGLTPAIVERLAGENSLPDVLVTVDNGISAIEGVAAAKAAGLQVIVTDHHLPGELLPAADAIVNPNQPDCGFVSKHAAGVGVMFYVLSVLRRHLRETGHFPAGREPAMADFLDLVALGTVADVVPLDHNNRILVDQGIRRIRRGMARPGILALLEVAGKDFRQISASDLGFVVGPRLNAAGRLDDMSRGIECLLADDPLQARALALELDRLNRERRGIEDGMRQQAQQLMETLSLDGAELPWGLALFDGQWHQGVIGILASRIKEQVHRPVIAMAPAEEKGLVKGSARSIPGLHIRDLLADVDARHPGLLRQFGGHAMAAGMSLDADRVPQFQTAFDRRVRELLDADALEQVILTDGSLHENELTLATAQLLDEAGPWGQQFPEPLFDGEFAVINQRIVGEKHLKLLVRPLDGRELVDAICFNTGADVPDYCALGARLVFRPEVNHFRGRRSLQILVQHIEPLA